MQASLPPITPQGLPVSPPALYRPSPSSNPANPFVGGTGSGGSKAPSLDGPYSGKSASTPSRMPSPTTIASAAGSGGAILSPVVAVPLAVWGALFENPGAAGLTPEQNARQLQPGFGRGFFPDSPRPSNPQNPDGARKLPKSPKPPPSSPLPGTKAGQYYLVTYRAIGGAGQSLTGASNGQATFLARGGISGLYTRKVGAITVFYIHRGLGIVSLDQGRGVPFDLVVSGDPGIQVSLVGVAPESGGGPSVNPDKPPSPPNPANSGNPPPSVNPNQKTPDSPNPSNLGSSPPSSNPSQKTPQTPNPDKTPQTPNPARTGQAPPSSNPSQKTPQTPNPARPSLPGSVVPSAPNPGNTTPNPATTNPSQKTPTSPNPGAIVPQIPGAIVPQIPGAIVPQIPGAIVPTSPNPLRPIRQPNPSSCTPNPCLSSLNQGLKPEVIKVKEFIGCYKILGIKKYFRDAFVSVPAGSSYAWTLCLNNQADLLAQACDREVGDCIAAVPDWWQVRLGSDRPQLMVAYAARFPDGTWDKAKYMISVPHWNKSKLLTAVDNFPTYRKGQYQGVMVLPDNSKLIVNAYTSEEATAAIDKFALGIPPTMVSSAVTKVASRRGRDLLSIIVYPRSVRYFATGQMDLNPTWSKKF